MIRIFKFKKNDLNPSGGKQIEYSITDVKDFFHFQQEEETVEFKFIADDPNSPLNGFRFKSTFKLSPARGDYKCYGNTDGSINLKSFFLEKLHLSQEDNIEDSYALKKIGEKSYQLVWFPKGIEFYTVAQFFYNNNIDIEERENKTCNSPLDEPLQQIFFGAPGTGKSFKINDMCAQYESYRTTFHPDTDYASFVGSYKPITKSVPQYDIYHNIIVDKDTHMPVMEDRIVYRYVFQSFLKAYIAAWKEQQKENPQPVFLVIEEINRGNCAQIFGDIFQLLDRNESGYSDYPIVADDDLAQELKREFKNLAIANPQGINNLYKGGKDVVASVKDGSRLLLPNNLYIWATMNTSDQSLFPIDSAFKRRWDWKYIKIKDNAKNYRIVFSNGNEYDWWEFVTAINDKIEFGEIQQEDKKLGYFFAKSKDGRISAERFLSKVIFYLYNDVFKDFGFDEDFFKGADDKPMTFASYFDETGEADENQIERFITNLGLESKLTKEDNQDVNSEGRDLTRYIISDNEGNILDDKSYTKMRIAPALIREYVKIHPKKNAREIVSDWVGIAQDLPKKVKFFIQTEDDHETRNDSAKDKSEKIDVNGEAIYVTTHDWSYDKIIGNSPLDKLIDILNKANIGVKLIKE